MSRFSKELCTVYPALVWEMKGFHSLGFALPVPLDELKMAKNASKHIVSMKVKFPRQTSPTAAISSPNSHIALIDPQKEESDDKDTFTGTENTLFPKNENFVFHEPQTSVINYPVLQNEEASKMLESARKQISGNSLKEKPLNLRKKIKKAGRSTRKRLTFIEKTP